MNELCLDCDLVVRILENFIREELAKFGFTRGVVGLSGGIDSTLSTYLAARALGPENVTAITMPYRTSSPESEGDARLVAEDLGLELVKVDISPQVDAYFDRFPDADRMRRANKMARERMAILYDLSAERDALVIGTSNKTEALLGYTTLWGDMASAVNPLGDLYKTQVRELSRFLNIPEAILTKSPSADLWPGQTDEAELGFSYADVDRALYWLVDQRRRPEDMIEDGFDPEFIARVRKLIRLSQYKRRLPPPVAKLSRRSVDRDFRYPRDWQA
ncbi:MAG TPA: NAD+ synthase [Armatimonadota bacterium]|jgi:NAD+ synthase